MADVDISLEVVTLLLLILAISGIKSERLRNLLLAIVLFFLFGLIE